MWNRRVLTWFKWSVPAWAIFGIINGTQVCVGMYAAGMRHNWSRLFAVFSLSWMLWVFATPAVLWLGESYPVRRFWHVHLAAYLGIGLASAAWSAGLEALLRPLQRDQDVHVVKTTFELFYSKFHIDLFAYCGILAVGQLIYSKKTLALRDEQLAQERLDSLRRQLQPHFLFNTLNGIAGLIRIGKTETAVDMVAGLSELLRRVVDGQTAEETTLSEEIRFLEKYVELQQMRLGDRLFVSYEIDPSVEKVRVPSMLLQPLVENALEHGIARRLDGGYVQIIACKGANKLILSVRNSGSLPDVVNEGVGLTNTRARLKSKHGEQASLTIQQNGLDVVEVEIRIPIHA